MIVELDVVASPRGTHHGLKQLWLNQVCDGAGVVQGRIGHVKHVLIGVRKECQDVGQILGKRALTQTHKRKQRTAGPVSRQITEPVSA